MSARKWIVIAAAASVCLAAAAGIVWLRARAVSPAALLKRLPRRDAVVVYVDFAALRQAGILKLLSGAGIAEPDYERFTRTTRFDYSRDLDLAIVSFAPGGRFLLLKGRFDWSSLRSYVQEQQGACYDSLCRMTGSAAERRISFFPVRSNLMALAVSTDESAALRMGEPASGPPQEMPAAPVWLSIPPSVLKAGGDLPAGTRMFARGLEQAESVILSFAPDGERIAARLDVTCRSRQDAADIAAQLARATKMLGDMIARDGQRPNPADLSGVLSSGVFHSQDRKVAGYWPIERVFVESALAP